jgi:fucose 4-O-acetylase-like acetyltransferase
VESASGPEEPGRDRYVDFLRVVAIGFVVFGHWLVTSVEYRGGTFRAADVLGRIWWAPWVTWAFQVMPVFFLVGGFAAAVSWRRAGNDTGHATRWLRRRVLRLLIPTTWYVIAALVATTAAARAGVNAQTLGLAGWAVALHLWFLPVYLILTLLTPLSYAAHRRWGAAVPAAMALAGAAIDIVVITAHVRALGWLNYVLVWGAAYQLGFAWQDGTLARTPRRTWLIAAGGAAVFVVLEWSGLFPVSLIGMQGQRINNTAPPSIALEAYAAAQLSTLIAVAPKVSGWLRRSGPRRMVEACNSDVMTVYLWHMLPVVVAGVLLYPSGLMPQPAAGTAQWWILRPVWIAVLALLLAPLLLAGRRLRRPRPNPHPRLQPQSTASPGPPTGGYPPLLYAAIALTSFALARFAIAGFAPYGRLPVSATAVYAAGVLLMAADGLLVRRRRLALESAAAR